MTFLKFFNYFSVMNFGSYTNQTIHNLAVVRGGGAFKKDIATSLEANDNGQNLWSAQGLQVLMGILALLSTIFYQSCGK
jgi:hypothetical protein